MIEETIAKLEESLRQAQAAKGESQEELLHLLTKLRAEVGELAKTHADEAKSIAGFAAVSTHEATRPEPNPELVKLSVSGLAESVAEFEGTHPRLVQIVNSICNTLSNLGI